MASSASSVSNGIRHAGPPLGIVGALFAIPLGIFTATAVSQMRFLGARVAGTYIALFGGFATAFTMLVSSSVLWTLTQPGIVQDRALVQALYWLDQGLGGTGFSVPFGLLIAGISIPAWLMKLLPRWIVIPGLLIAICGELSWIISSHVGH